MNADSVPEIVSLPGDVPYCATLTVPKFDVTLPLIVVSPPDPPPVGIAAPFPMSTTPSAVTSPDMVSAVCAGDGTLMMATAAPAVTLPLTVV